MGSKLYFLKEHILNIFWNYFMICGWNDTINRERSTKALSINCLVGWIYVKESLWYHVSHSRSMVTYFYSSLVICSLFSPKIFAHHSSNCIFTWIQSNIGYSANFNHSNWTDRFSTRISYAKLTTQWFYISIHSAGPNKVLQIFLNMHESDFNIKFYLLHW